MPSESKHELSFMDDFCKDKQIFLTNNDRVNYVITKSKSHFGLFKKTVDGAFKNVKVWPEVFNMDKFLEETGKRATRHQLTRKATLRLSQQQIQELMQDRKDYVYTKKQQNEFAKLGEILDQDYVVKGREQT